MEKNIAPTAPETTHASELAFSRGVSALAAELPEVADAQADIVSGGAELIREFAISPELFDDEPSVLFMSALAKRYADLERSRDGMTIDAYTTEKHFIGAATAMLATETSGLYDELRPLLTRTEKHDPEQLERIYDRYTNRQMTAELASAMNGDLIGDVKKAMGITSENEDAYVVRVLNIGKGPVLQGMYPDRPATTQEEDPVAWAKYQQAIARYDAFEAGLAENTYAFAKETRSTTVPPAWINRFGSVTSLNIPLPIAQKVLHPQEFTNTSYSDYHLRRDIGIVGHEYAHTQGGYNVRNGVHYGIGLEERRAEYYAGDKAGYDDVKAASMDMAALTATNMFRRMDQQPKGGPAIDLFIDLAKNVGLQNTLKLALIAPKNYLEVAGELPNSVNAYIGGYDAIIRDIYDRMMQDGSRAPRVRENIANWANGISTDGEDSIEQWVAWRQTDYESQFMTDLVSQAARAARASDTNKK